MRSEGGVKHYYLLEWNKNSDLACRSLIYFLKNKPPVFFTDLGKHFKHDFAKLRQGAAVIPSCSDQSKVNHADSLAQALMKLNLVSGVLKVGMIKESSIDQQKRKTKLERLKSNKVDLKGFGYAKDWIFVDDVLVSGGTFKSIFESMFTKPQAIFTLLYKPRLKNKGFYDA